MISEKSLNGRIIQVMLAGAGLFSACELPQETSEYHERPVIYGNLTAYTPFMDTLFVAMTVPLDGEPEQQSWVSGASATVTGSNDTIDYYTVHGKPGRYVTHTSRLVQPYQTYRLEVSWGSYHVSSTTRVPDTVSIQSVESGGWECDGHEEVVPAINLHRMENSMEEITEAAVTGDFSQLVMDTVVYREGSCYASSFASIPMFVIRWKADQLPGMIRAVSVALEDTVTQAIIDTSLMASAFKGPMHIDDNGNYYRPSPVVWNLSQPELHFGWLSFNYYGPHLIMIQATDESFRDYFQGDALEQNPYILPQGNIEGGYGLFSSVSSQSFLVYVAQDTSGSGRN